MRRVISNIQRFRVFRRDNFTCQYCGARAPEAILECDHVNPVVAGGRNCDENLVTSCQACNNGKSAWRLDDENLGKSEISTERWGRGEKGSTRKLREQVRRRRRLSLTIKMPPELAANFTTAELAALHVISDDVASRGHCDACNDEIAARAGVSRSSAKKAVRVAEGLGLIVRQERRYRGKRSDTNILTIVSQEWLRCST